MGSPSCRGLSLRFSSSICISATDNSNPFDLLRFLCANRHRRGCAVVTAFSETSAPHRHTTSDKMTGVKLSERVLPFFLYDRNEKKKRGSSSALRRWALLICSSWVETSKFCASCTTDNRMWLSCVNILAICNANNIGSAKRNAWLSHKLKNKGTPNWGVLNLLLNSFLSPLETAYSPHLRHGTSSLKVTKRMPWLNHQSNLVAFYPTKQMPKTLTPI